MKLKDCSEKSKNYIQPINLIMYKNAKAQQLERASLSWVQHILAEWIIA